MSGDQAGSWFRARVFPEMVTKPMECQERRPYVDHPDKIQVILNPAPVEAVVPAFNQDSKGNSPEEDFLFPQPVDEAPGHVEALSQEAAKRGTDLILVVGGDGTIHEVANAEFWARALTHRPIAVIPVGTGNDFYRMVVPAPRTGYGPGRGSKWNVEDFDVGRVRFDGKESYFVNLLGLGVDVEVLRKREDFPRLGGLPQYLAALGSSGSFAPGRIRVTGGRRGGGGRETIEDRTILMAVTVGPSVGGGFLLSPEPPPTMASWIYFSSKPLAC